MEGVDFFVELGLAEGFCLGPEPAELNVDSLSEESALDCFLAAVRFSVTSKLSGRQIVDAPGIKRWTFLVTCDCNFASPAHPPMTETSHGFKTCD